MNRQDAKDAKEAKQEGGGRSPGHVFGSPRGPAGCERLPGAKDISLLASVHSGSSGARW